MRPQRLLVIAVLFSALSGCDSERLTQFSSFATAGSQYVQNFHQLTAQAGSAMIASDSAVLIVARTLAGPALEDHKPEFTSNVQKDDQAIEDYLLTLQQLDAHATLLGSYFAAITQLTNGSATTKVVTSADSLLDSINAFNPQIEKAKVGGQPIKSFIQPTSTLIVDHFEVKALDDQLKKAAPAIDEALSLQEAAVDALTAQIKASQGVSLQVRESTDVINPYVAPGSLPAGWATNRESFLRDEVTINGLSSAKSAISQLHTAFRQLVQDKKSSLDLTTLMSDIEKMSGYVSAVGSTTSSTETKK
jgi:hypothetical protein